ncbi:hypothetical protein [Pseudonocardia acaciae]|uniref:hypothetical protein n=1 Tax=Pseudonocardia acaciae TaxID=551276 RepID=UPI0012EE5F79|nr:hypothetical protein [Pseudonocardia acaciae]
MVFRERRPSRHRAVESDPADLMPEDELESYLAALSPEADGSASELTGRFGSAQVFQVRLPALRIEQLKRLAADRGVAPTALVVDWVIERLDREDPGYASPPLKPSGGHGAVRSGAHNEVNRDPLGGGHADTRGGLHSDTRGDTRDNTHGDLQNDPLGGLHSPASHHAQPSQHARPEAPPAPGPATSPMLSPIDQLIPVGEVTSVDAEPDGDRPDEEAPVTPLFGSAAHAAKPEERSRRPRHRAPEPVTSLLTRRKF